MLIRPIIGGIIAPPTITIINSPDISLDLEGILFIAIEKTNGNRFPAPKPTMKIAEKAIISLVENRINNVPVKAKIVVVTKKKEGF